MNARLGMTIGIVAIGFALHIDADPTSTLPGPAFDAGRYTNLWTKSPFAIATPDAPAISEDYELVGMAQFDGVSYVSLISKQNSDHFVLSSDKPLKDPKHNLDLQLVSIVHGSGGASAIILRNGESLTLHQEDAAVPGAQGSSGPGGVPFPQPGMVASPNPSVGGFVPANNLPPPAHVHRRLIRIPPLPQ